MRHYAPRHAFASIYQYNHRHVIRKEGTEPHEENNIVIAFSKRTKSVRRKELANLCSTLLQNDASVSYISWHSFFPRGPKVHRQLRPSSLSPGHLDRLLISPRITAVHRQANQLFLQQPPAMGPARTPSRTGNNQPTDEKQDKTCRFLYTILRQLDLKPVGHQHSVARPRWS